MLTYELNTNIAKHKDYMVFDLDGTLANVNHRRHFVRTLPKNYGAFEKACIFDPPNTPVVNLYKDVATRYERIILSGRTQAVETETRAWLWRHGINFDVLMMRPVGDFREDHILKSEFMDQIIAERDGKEPDFIVDDRPQVVRMWRKRGFFVFDVNQSGEEF